MTKLGFCTTVTQAEIRAIRSGLMLSIEKGFKKILIYIDSVEALNLLLRGYIHDHPLAGDIEETRSLMNRN